jgi:mannosyltransferase OCH1-like enzyme
VDIPHVFHQIWLGGLVMPPKLAAWTADWRRLHPKWELRLWHECGDGRIAANGFEQVSQYPELLARACHLSQRSDIWRYELINRFGGVYLDTDMEPLRPIDDLLIGVQTFASLMIAHRDKKTQVCLGCSVFGAVPNHPWTNGLVARMSEEDPTIHGSLSSHYFAKVTADYPEVTRFVPGVLSATNRTVGGYAIHHWSSRWWQNSFKRLNKEEP